jgi:hypothetical protein
MAKVIINILGLIVAGAIVGGVVASCENQSKSVAKAQPKTKVHVAKVQPTAQASKVKVEPVELVDGWGWRYEHDMFLKVSSVTVKNNTNEDIKDFEIVCNSFAESGTRIDSNKREQFKIIKAGQSLNLGTVDMGFLRNQVKQVGCYIGNYKKV